MFTTKSRIVEKEPDKKEIEVKNEDKGETIIPLGSSVPPAKLPEVNIVTPVVSPVVPSEPAKAPKSSPKDYLGNLDDEDKRPRRKPQATRVTEMEEKDAKKAAIWKYLRIAAILLKKLSSQLEVMSWFGLAVCMFWAGSKFSKGSWSDVLIMGLLATLFINNGLRLPSSKIGTTIQKAYARLTQQNG